tara:strand:- start:278 stop:787 length:510 start_codon:yes stop_codon:yes gene_type:complete
MPTGLKQSSSVVSIGFSATEAVAGTVGQTAVDLNLSPLDREVFVVLAINLDSVVPELIPGVNTNVKTGLTTTRQTGMPQLSDANCLGRLTQSIRSSGPGEAVSFASGALETPPSGLDYIGIIATSDFFVQVQGTNNVGLSSATGKMYGYRATASADIFAALVQSEVLSA